MAGEYTGADNEIKELHYEHLTADGWQIYDPGNHKAGFLIFLYALFNCQHMHFRMKSAERSLKVGQVSGELDVQAEEDWTITQFKVHIGGKLVSGQPNDDDIAYIIDRMRHCPSSINLKFQDAKISISLS